jgi:L-lactate dehydrogenase complex protein LldG
MEESTSREKVLKKVRHALIYKTDNPYPQVDFDSPVYSPLTDTPDVHFAQEFSATGGVFMYCENEREAIITLSALCREYHWENLYCADPEFQYLLTRAGVPFESDTEKLKQIQIAVTGCEQLIARTGSILLSSKNSRKLNVAATTHLVIAFIDQLVDDIKDAIDSLQKRYGNKLPSMISMVTGPSRTADIEKTLVMGAHGPSELWLILIEARPDEDAEEPEDEPLDLPLEIIVKPASEESDGLTQTWQIKD